MTRTHVLIDLDGTLSDSHAGIARSLQYAFAECGFEPPTDHAVRDAIGPPFEVSFPKLGVGPDDFERVVDKYRERYNDIGLFENTVYDGIPEMLETLRADGLTLALATAKPEEPARRITTHFGLSHHFAFEAGSSGKSGNRRTKADVITYALAALSISAGDHVVMLGDRNHDVEGAIANGIDCIGVSWGFGSHKELAGAGAIAVANRPADVAGLITHA